MYAGGNLLEDLDTDIDIVIEEGDTFDIDVLLVLIRSRKTKVSLIIKSLYYPSY